MTENGNKPEKVQSFKSENTTHWTWKRTRGEPAPKGSGVGGGCPEARKQTYSFQSPKAKTMS